MEGDGLALGFVALVAGLGWLTQNRQRNRPVEVGITLGPLDGDQLQHVFVAQRQLHAAGVRFDTGMMLGSGERDWEWDWSLEGPAQVRFRRFKG